jgi:hypothetical protein
MTDPKKPDQVGFLVAIDRLFGTIIMLFATLFGLIVVLIVRTTDALRGKCETDQSSRTPPSGAVGNVTFLGMSPSATPSVATTSLANAPTYTTPSTSLSVPIDVPQPVAAVAAPSAVLSVPQPLNVTAMPPPQVPALPSAQPAKLTVNTVPDANHQTALRARRDAPLTKPPAETRTVEPTGDRADYRGILLWYGMSWHSGFNNRRYECFTVHLDCGAGLQVLQGKELEACIEDAGVGLGASVLVQMLGKIEVSVRNGRPRYMNKWAVSAL